MIPKTKSAHRPAPAAPTQQIQIADQATVGLWVIQLGDHLRAAGDIATRLFNEIDKRQALINSLPKAEPEKAPPA